METSSMALVQGWSDTRFALHEWNARPWPVLRRWTIASAVVGVGLLLAIWVVATLTIPNPAPISANGYAFQIETTYRVKRAGFRVVEVPITFRDRQLGRSKMSSRIALEAMWLVPQLRRRRHRARSSAASAGS